MFEIVVEFLLQLVGELLFEQGLHALKEPFQHRPNPWVAAIAYAFCGLLTGLVLNWMFPIHFVPPTWRWANLLITPVLVGWVMVLVGRIREKRGDAVYRIDKFAYGYLFALTLAVVRLVWVG